MNREEALNVIWLRCQHNDKTYEAYCALKNEQQPCDDATLKDIFCMGCEYKEQEPCDKCINRQAALDALSHMMDTDGFRDGWAVSRANVDCMLRSLPPVTPQQKDDASGYTRSHNEDIRTTDAKKCVECAKEHRQLAEWLKELKQSREQTQWIPVSERLPKFADVYRVTRYYPNNVMNPSYIVDACFFDGSNIWYNDNRINHERDYANNVIAWQENPEPYKGEINDSKGIN